MTSSRSSDGLDALLNQICACSSIDRLQSVVLQNLADDLGVASASFQEVQHITCDPRLVRAATRGVTVESNRVYEREFPRFYQNLIAHSERPRAFDAFRLSRDASGARSVAASNMSAIWSPDGINDVLVIRVDYRIHDSFFFGFHRLDGHCPFGERELNRVSALVPALLSTVTKLRAEEDLARATRHISDLERLLAHSLPAAVLDGDRHILYANASGRALLDKVATQGPASRHLDGICNELHQSAADGAHRQLRLQGIDLHVARTATEGSERFILSPVLASAAGIASLSPREREIADNIARGLSNKEIASIYDLSVYTIENHLRAIFRKLGVDSRVKVALALNGTAHTGGQRTDM